MRVKVLYHDSCFDGAASAAVFSRFYKERVDPKATFAYQGLSHKPGGIIEESLLDADVNTVVDFRYTDSPRLTWWFDHHQSAFPNKELEAHFRRDTSGHKFFDPTAKSCTKFLARMAEQKFGFDPKPLKDLIDWAELIDGAQFPNAAFAVRLEAPALKLMTVLENNRDPKLIPRLIQDLTHKSIDEVVREPYIAEPLKPLLSRHQQTIELIRKKASIDRGVVFFDVADEGVEAFNKFIAYDLFPDAVYTVAVSRSPQRSKVSIGSNAWAPEKRTHDLSKLAEKYGGGGHPVVAAVSLGPDELPKARQAAAEIVEALKKRP